MLQLLFAPALIGALAALAAGWLLIPILRKLKAGQFISTDAPERHRAKGGTPTMGGAIIVVGLVVACLAYPTPGRSPLLTGVLLCTLGFGLIGFLDDFLIISRGRNLGLRAREKLLGQFIVAILFVWWYWHADPTRVPLGSPAVTPLRLALCVYFVFLLVGMSNSVNLTDGLDGLAGGVSLPVWMTLGLLGAFTNTPEGIRVAGMGDYGVVVFCAAFAGATIGYLWYNAHPAQVFMGDTGSLAIGGGIAAAAIALHQEWIILIAAAVHLIEAASVTLQVISFKLTGRRIFKMSPLHHHFELCEWPETRIVARFAIVSTLCGLLALLIAFAR